MLLDRLQRQLIFLAPAVVLSAWGTVMLHTLLVGHINRLLNPMFREYVGIAAVVLFILSALHLLLYRPSPERVPGAGRQLGRWLVLLVPVVAACALSPAAFSNTTIQIRSGPNGVAPMPNINNKIKQETTDALSTDPSQPAPMEVTDLVTVAHTPELIGKFEGRPVRVVGLFTAGDPAKLTRWIMWCCAADAAPASVTMSGQMGGPWKDQQWVEVTGIAHFPTTMGQAVPQIDVTSAKQTAEPDEPFLSP